MATQEKFGISLPAELRESLGRLAELKGISLNALIRKTLQELADRHAGMLSLDRARREAQNEAFAAHEGEWRAAKAVLETARGRLDAVKGLYAEVEREVQALRSRLLAGDLQPDAAADLRRRLEELEVQKRILLERAHDCESAVKDTQTRLENIARAIWDSYREAFERRAWPILEDELARTADQIRTFLTWCLDLLAETRNVVGPYGLRATRYLLHRLDVLAQQNAPAPVAAVLERRLFTTAPKDPGWLRSVLHGDLPPLNTVRHNLVPEEEDVFAGRFESH